MMGSEQGLGGGAEKAEGRRDEDGAREVVGEVPSDVVVPKADEAGAAGPVEAGGAVRVQPVLEVEAGARPVVVGVSGKAGVAGGAGGAPVVGYAPDRRRRLNIATVLVAVVGAARSLSWAIAIALLLRFSGRSGGFVEVMIAGLGSLQVAFAAVRYVTTRFAIESGGATGGVGAALVIESGLLFKKRRAVPVGRIQNINISRDLAHRMFGVAEIKIETAAGADAEANLSALSLAEAEELKRDLLAAQREARGEARGAIGGGAGVGLDGAVGEAGPQMAGGGVGAVPGVVEVAPSPTPAEQVYAASLTDLLLAGATRSRIGAVIGAAFGAFYFLDDVLGSAVKRFMPANPGRVVTNLVERVYDTHGDQTVSTVIFGVFVVVLALVAGWLLSIGTSVVQHWKFTLERAPDGKLTRRFGLLTVHDLAFPRKRLQRLTITAPIIQRKLGMCRVEARTAGSYLEKENAGTAMLFPIVRRGRLVELCGNVVDGFDPHTAEWKHVSPVAVRRWTLRNSVLLLVFLAVASWWWGMWWLMAASPLVVVLGWWLARAEWRTTGYAIQGGLILYRDGVITRVMRVIPKGRVQVSEVLASPIQRYLGLADLKLSTAADLMGSDARIPNLNREVAEGLQDGLMGGRG